jgi:hypothetical protein
MENNNRKLWLRRVGVAGFFFFLIKGIAWLFVGSWLIKMGCN